VVPVIVVKDDNVEEEAAQLIVWWSFVRLFATEDALQVGSSASGKLFVQQLPSSRIR